MSGPKHMKLVAPWPPTYFVAMPAGRVKRKDSVRDRVLQVLADRGLRRSEAELRAWLDTTARPVVECAAALGLLTEVAVAAATAGLVAAEQVQVMGVPQGLGEARVQNALFAWGVGVAIEFPAGISHLLTWSGFAGYYVERAGDPRRFLAMCREVASGSATVES